MSNKLSRRLAALPLLTAAAFAGEPVTSPPAVVPASTRFDLTQLFNAADVKYVGSFDMDFENSVGSIDAQAIQATAFLSKPLHFGDWQFIPQFAYESMLLSSSGPVPSIILRDEDLHEIELSLYFIHMKDTSPWVYGAWINPSLATDFQSISGDDFFLDAAGAVGYQVNDHLLIGAGAGALNISGDTTFIAGPGFAWQPNDKTMVALYGPNFRAIYDVTPKWRVSLEVRPNGGIWNIDTALGSANIDYENYRAGLTSEHNLFGDLWLSYGAGITFGGTINVTTTDGSKVFQNQLDDLESGYYGFVGLELKKW